MASSCFSSSRDHVHVPGSHHAFQVLFGQGFCRCLGLSLRWCVGVLVILKQLHHLQVVELHRIIQGNVAPPKRNQSRDQGKKTVTVLWSHYMTGVAGGHRERSCAQTPPPPLPPPILAYSYLSLTKGFTLQASIRNLTTSMCPSNMSRRRMRWYRSSTTLDFGS